VFNAPRSSGILGDFSVSVDYYKINIKNVISTVPGLTVLSKCFNLDGSNPTYSNANLCCGLIQRDASGQLVSVATPYLNLGALKTDGVEVQVHWCVPATPIGETGKLYVDSAIGWLHNYSVQLLPGAAFLDYTGVSNGGAGTGAVPPRATPKWKALTTFGYRSSAVGARLRWRYQNAMRDVSSVLTPATAAIGGPAYSLLDLFGTVKTNKQFELRAGGQQTVRQGAAVRREFAERHRHGAVRSNRSLLLCRCEGRLLARCLSKPS
jgi:iron complex outermembrane receptor protein